MHTRENIDTLVRKFFDLASSELKIRSIYLFGSYASGKSDEHSDINLAVVADNFEGSRFFDRKKMYEYVLETSTDFEFHPFRTDEFRDDNPFVKEIKTSGIKLV